MTSGYIIRYYRFRTPVFPSLSGFRLCFSFSLECQVRRIDYCSSQGPHLSFTAPSLFLQDIFYLKQLVRVWVHKIPIKKHLVIFNSLLAILYMTTFFKRKHFIEVWYTYTNGHKILV